MRLHSVALPHMPVLRENSTCAFTQKVIRFSEMASALGHDIITYGSGPDFDGAGEYVDCGEGPPTFNPSDWHDFNMRAVDNIDDGTVCLIAGIAQQQVAESLPHLQAVEWGVGYGGIFTEFCAFESHAWRHTVYGARASNAHAADGRFYDTVIPNSYWPDEFPEGTGNGGYALFVGRLIERKGLGVAVDACQRAGVNLLVAGDGDYRPEGATYLGLVGPEARAELMGGASVLLAPTLYVEPFGGVVVEAQMCGTPVLTTDWGAFTETVDHGSSGFRCTTLAEFCDGLRLAPLLDRDLIRRKALGRWSCDVVKHDYDRWLRRVADVPSGGWYGEWSDISMNMD